MVTMGSNAAAVEHPAGVPLMAGSSGDSASVPPVAIRPCSPRLGNFDSVFDLCFVSKALGADSVDTADASDATDATYPPSPIFSNLTSPSASPPLLPSPSPSAHNDSPVFSTGFFSGLDLSSLGSLGFMGPLSIDPTLEPIPSISVEATRSRNGAGRHKHDRTTKSSDEDGSSDGQDGPDVLIATASTSPSSYIDRAIAEATLATPPPKKRTPRRTPKASRVANSTTSLSSTLQHSIFAPPPLTSPHSASHTASHSGAHAVRFARPGMSPAVGPAQLASAAFHVNFHPHDEILPLYSISRQAQLDILRNKLEPEYSKDRSLAKKHGASPIHVFVDMSNIVIGFYNRMRFLRGIPQHKRMRAPPFFFQGLAEILERGRRSERKVTAGSVPDSSREAWPAYMNEAEALGYEMNILSRVNKPVPSPIPSRSTPVFGATAASGSGNPASPASRHHRRLNSSPGWKPTADPYSSSDDATVVAGIAGGGGGGGGVAGSFKIGEQAVDEVLHLKMCHSVLDYDSGTIVLATGDAAEAEFSDGFLKHVERALGRGWCVELFAWNGGISSAWRELEQKQKKSGRFRIIILDKYAEELLALFSDSSAQLSVSF